MAPVNEVCGANDVALRFALVKSTPLMFGLASLGGYVMTESPVKFAPVRLTLLKLVASKPSPVICACARSAPLQSWPTYVPLQSGLLPITPRLRPVTTTPGPSKYLDDDGQAGASSHLVGSDAGCPKTAGSKTPRNDAPA